MNGLWRYRVLSTKQNNVEHNRIRVHEWVSWTKNSEAHEQIGDFKDRRSNGLAARGPFILPGPRLWVLVR